MTKYLIMEYTNENNLKWFKVEYRVFPIFWMEFTKSYDTLEDAEKFIRNLKVKCTIHEK